MPKENAPVTATFTSSDGAKIVLPAGTSVDTIMVRGDNLILVQEDGSIIVIVDGAKFAPTLVLGGIEIPSASLALIIKDAPDDVPTAGPSTTQTVAEGPEQVPSSGGDFTEVLGDIGDPFPIGPLLPPTALKFFVPQVKEEEPGVLEETGALAGPPDLIPTQVPGASVGGVVEEEELQDGRQNSPTQLSDGNEDGTPDEDLDPDAGGDATTHSFSGNAANLQSLQNLVAGGDQPITFSLNDVTGAAVADATGADVFSKGAQVYYHWIDANHLIGFADDDPASGAGVYDGAINDNPEPGGNDRIVFTLDVLPNGDWTLTIYDQFDHLPDLNTESVLTLNLTSTIHATDGNGSPLDFTGSAFAVGVIDDIPILTDRHKIEIVDEDDIKTFQSLGTHPNDGDIFDGSFTGDPPSDSFGPATVYGSLQSTVKVGADEGIENDLTFSFVEGEDAEAALNGLTNSWPEIQGPRTRLPHRWR